MSDWQVGDLAVCVHTGVKLENGIRGHGGSLLQEGRTYEVEGISFCPLFQAEVLHLVGIRSEDRPTNGAFAASRFRKADKHEACKPAFAALLKRKPVEHIIGCDGDD